MLSSVLGFLALVAVVVVALIERGQAEIRFFDWHAAIVVLGGVAGSLLIALKGSTFLTMLWDWLQVVTGRDPARRSLDDLREQVRTLEDAWKAGRRGEVLDLIERAEAPEELRLAADVLVQHHQGDRLRERFETLRLNYSNRMLPQVEGWDLVARLAPSFGIVGTVAGMVQLFRNMAANSGGLGGAMALALLATLYGILLGTAVGGPMSTRLNQIMNERLDFIDLLERKVLALLEEDRGKRRSIEALS